MFPSAETPMLEDADEGGVRLWHLVKASEEPELPKHRRGSLRERERAKAIPEIYLTRLLSMKVRPTFTFKYLPIIELGVMETAVEDRSSCVSLHVTNAITCVHRELCRSLLMISSA